MIDEFNYLQEISRALFPGSVQARISSPRMLEDMIHNMRTSSSMVGIDDTVDGTLYCRSGILEDERQYIIFFVVSYNDAVSSFSTHASALREARNMLHSFISRLVDDDRAPGNLILKDRFPYWELSGESLTRFAGLYTIVSFTNRLDLPYSCQRR